MVDECCAAANSSDLVARVASALAASSEPWPPFAIVAARGADIVVVVHGPVEVTAVHEGGEARLYGGDEVGSWLNRLMRGSLRVSAGGAVSEDDPADLREGLIRADGFLLTAPRGDLPSANARAAASSTTTDAGSEVAAASGSDALEAADGSGEAAPELESQAAPAGDAASEAGATGVAPGGTPSSWAEVSTVDVDAQGPTVVERPNPDADIAADLTVAERLGEGAFVVEGGLVAEGAQVPVLGRLTWDNGEVHQLMGAVLVGRDVSGDPAVMAGQLVPLVPSGQNDSMSRVHAELRPRNDELVVLDRGSTNGTFVWDEASRAWQRLTTGEPRSVTPGSVLAFGERTATFQAVPAPVS